MEIDPPSLSDTISSLLESEPVSHGQSKKAHGDMCAITSGELIMLVHQGLDFASGTRDKNAI